jgi:hypothetical protein
MKRDDKRLARTADDGSWNRDLGLGKGGIAVAPSHLSLPGQAPSHAVA